MHSSVCSTAPGNLLTTSESAGGVSVGRQKLRQQQVLNSSPLEMQFRGGGTVPSRAAAAAGQSGLMALYDSLFGMMDLQAAQVLVTRNDFTGKHDHVSVFLMGHVVQQLYKLVCSLSNPSTVVLYGLLVRGRQVQKVSSLQAEVWVLL